MTDKQVARLAELRAIEVELTDKEVLELAELVALEEKEDAEAAE